MDKCRIITIANEKGGCGKTTTCRNLGTALTNAGERVLLVDLNHQANLSLSVGIDSPASLSNTIADIMNSVLDGIDIIDGFVINCAGVDIIPSNKNLAITEANLSVETGGERILAEILSPLRAIYDYILIDTGPTMGALTINALAACDSVIIPVSPEYWSATGFTDLTDTISKIKRRINKNIRIEGILMTMCEAHTILYREVREILEECVSDKIKIFDSIIPRTTKVGRANMRCVPIVEFEANNPASVAYTNLAKEVVKYGRKSKNRTCPASA